MLADVLTRVNARHFQVSQSVARLEAVVSSHWVALTSLSESIFDTRDAIVK